jgi:hypothetical protein
MPFIAAHRPLHTFFIQRKEEMDFRKSIGVILFHTLSQVVVILYHEFSEPSTSFNPELFMVIAGILATFLLSFASWVLFSGSLFVIARILRYPARLEVVILLTAYGYLPIAFGNLVTILLKILNMSLYSELSGVFMFLSIVLWVYAVKISGEISGESTGGMGDGE